MCLLNLKCADPLPETHLFFVWPSQNASEYRLDQEILHSQTSGEPMRRRHVTQTAKAKLSNQLSTLQRMSI